MNNNNTELQTPKNKLRSLGLRRNTPKSTIPKTPLSDIKINYKSLQNETEVSSPFTPKLRQTLSTTSAFSTSCLPYRLSLSRGAREKYKKKKLEFAANQLALEAQNPSEPKQEEITKEKIIQRHRKHQEKVKELENVIAVWKEAFKTSLEELSSKIEPKMETEDLIARLGIPPDMIDYT